MIERLNQLKRPISIVLALSFGGAALTACSDEIKTHGVYSLRLLDCIKGPKKNKLSVANIANGDDFRLGKDIITSTDDDFTSGGIDLTSRGNGQFFVSVDSGKVSGIAKVSAGPLYKGGILVGNAESGGTLSFDEDNQHYVIKGTPGQDGATSVSIEASCVSTPSPKP